MGVAIQLLIDIMESTVDNLIDLTNLNPSASLAELKTLADTVLDKDLHSACIRPSKVKELMNLNQHYRLSAVIGFLENKYEITDANNLEKIKSSIGNFSLEAKKVEAANALGDGAIELDPVMKISDLDNLQKELQGLIETLYKFSLERPEEKFWMKPIFSCEILNDEEIERTAKIFSDVVARFYESNPDVVARIKFAYKNSTGYIGSKEESGVVLKTSSPNLISLIAKLLNKYDPKRNISIKAAGGIRDTETALLIQDSADGRLTHIGTSKLFTEPESKNTY